MPATNQSSDSDVTLPTVESIPAILTGVMNQIEFARSYVRELIDSIPKERWFEIPPGHHTHVAWQVGHLAIAEYGLLLFRIRGRSESDLDLIPGRFRKTYGKGTSPNPDATKNSTPEELLHRLDRVWETARIELPSFAPETLNEPVDPPYAAYPTKLGAVMFAPLHIHIHAGQIGYLRRGMGLDPIR